MSKPPGPKTPKAPAPRRRPRDTDTATGPETGPVTLEEARALVAAKRPARSAARVAPAMRAVAEDQRDTVTSPAEVGEERRELERRRRQEIARRVRDFADTMTVMKARGARAPRGPKGRSPVGARAAAAQGFSPIQILAEGDSWFDYPVPFFGGGIIKRLENRIGLPILNLAKAGDEVRYMLGVEERQLLARHLSQGSPAGGAWDVLLFSGGGNDIVGNPMTLWIEDFAPGTPPARLIRQARFDAALALVRAGYEDLISLRDALSPGTQLVFHGYDFAIPDGRGVCGFLGPWLKPTFDLHGFPDVTTGQAVVKLMLQQFAAMLTSLAKRKGVTLVTTQGVLAPSPASWHNELHPSSDGFDRFADAFRVTLKSLFPARVA